MIPIETLPSEEYEKPISYYTSADADGQKHTSSIQREANGMHNDNSVYIYNAGDNRDGLLELYIQQSFTRHAHWQCY